MNTKNNNNVESIHSSASDLSGASPAKRIGKRLLENSFLAISAA